jgi:hypothetical protein
MFEKSRQIPIYQLMIYWNFRNDIVSNCRVSNYYKNKRENDEFDHLLYRFLFIYKVGRYFLKFNFYYKEEIYIKFIIFIKNSE